jgi:hypothetical protein
MPQTAGRIGLHYTHVSIDGEPAQATQLFAGMIATAFVESDITRIIDAGVSCVDPGSVIARVVTDVRAIHREYPDDWRAARRQVRDRYTRFGGETRDRNGHELNTAGVVAALLYGDGDLRETLRIAFNFGWDADCNAATAGAVVGAIKGRRWMEAQGWRIDDRYRNITRPGMPEDETITGYGRRLVEVARRVIRENGGEETRVDERVTLRIARQRPANVEQLPAPLDREQELRSGLRHSIETSLAADKHTRARSAYLAICLGLAAQLEAERPADWARARQALQEHQPLLKLIADLPRPAGVRLQDKVRAAGLRYGDPARSTP